MCHFLPHRFDGNDSAIPTLEDITKLMRPTLNMDVVVGGAGADVANLVESGVPGVGLDVQGFYEGELVPANYFFYHHSQADTIDHIDIEDFRKCVGAVASLVYVIADMEQTLPRNSVRSEGK
jgi:carboxypeptidase Q